MLSLGHILTLLGAAELAIAGVASTGTIEARDTTHPRQPGVHRGCKKFAWVERGSACWQVADANGVSLSDFLAWNSGVGKGCESLWANTYACVGI
ncbi:hypothetical protein CP532_2862 [Ophiocordyceps camponoti-leonardi (nom. inval.)]|nr:hypothetical protein CP532_2862 [Ophiocordyceps camponoti-leonardi (nom. inval.)]